MKKEKKIRLTLNKETVKALSDDDLNQAKGGLNCIPRCASNNPPYFCEWN